MEHAIWFVIGSWVGMLISHYAFDDIRDYGPIIATIMLLYLHLMDVFK